MYHKVLKLVFHRKIASWMRAEISNGPANIHVQSSEALTRRHALSLSISQQDRKWTRDNLAKFMGVMKTNGEGPLADADKFLPFVQSVSSFTNVT